MMTLPAGEKAVTKSPTASSLSSATAIDDIEMLATDPKALDEKGRRRKDKKPVKTDALGQPLHHIHGKWAKFIPFTASGMPPDPPKSMQDATEIPLATASLISMLTFYWIHPLLKIGYQRPLQATDLWKLDESRSAGALSDQLLEAFKQRRMEGEEWNKKLKSGEIKPSFYKRRIAWPTRHFMGLGSKDGVDSPGIAIPLNDVFGRKFWLAGCLKLVSDGLTTTQPLVTRAIIEFGSQAYYAHRGVPGFTAPSVGKGIGLAIGLLFMNLFSSLFLHQFFGKSMEVGVLARGSLISAVYKQSMQLSGKSRAQIPNGRIISLISTDVSRIDFAAGFAHMGWTSMIQFIEVLIILLVVLGPSCLAGIGVMIVLIPAQTWAMKHMFAIRQKTAVWTDKRAKMIQEILGGMKVIKLFSWEMPYFNKLMGYRREELKRLRTLLIIRAGSMALAMSVPTLGSIVAFVVYSATGHGQTAATIFTSLTLFNLLRMPLMMLPMALGTITDASAAMRRLSAVFEAETVDARFKIDPDAKFAVEVKDGDFIWEGAPPEELTAKQQKKKEAMDAKLAKIQGGGRTSPSKIPDVKSKQSRSESPRRRGFHMHSGKATPDKVSGNATPTDGENADTQAHNTLKAEELDQGQGIKDDSMMEPAQVVPETLPELEVAAAPAQSLELRDINIQIPKGQLTAIVGTVGAGKSSFLSALIGDMKRQRGSVVFSGSIGYCAQTAWIQNATLMANVLFGQPYDEKRYRKAIRDACLEPDLAILPDGDMTEIGEKGINLSGGQRQRVGIARALYFNADIVALDDPLSAVDAHVGQYLFKHAIQEALAGKTRILVTHALHFLPYVDYVIVIKEGRVAERGTYEELMAQDGEFALLSRLFGGKIEAEKEDEEAKEAEAIESTKEKTESSDIPVRKPRAHMQEEERALGAVGGHVYAAYLKAANGRLMLPLVIMSIIMTQAAQVLNNYWLVWWEENTFNQPRGFYMGIYAVLGIAQAIFTFAMGAVVAFTGYNASKNLHNNAAKRVLTAPMSFFDTTPLGRIMTRFSKDVDTIDNTLNDALRMALSTFGQVMGAIVLIAIVNQYFLIAVACILYLYYRAAHYYRTSAREIKRLDNLLRSALYAHFSESLSGLPTIRAYGEQYVFLQQNVDRINTENRAYILTVFNQRWLGIRLDLFGSTLSFIVAIIAVAARNSISPAQIGLILSYIISVQMSFSWMVRQVAEVENDMNSTERMYHYGQVLEQEAPHEIAESKPAKSWPSQGQIVFDKIVMSYRPGLPIVLKGLSFEVSAGQKIGVVGRTGAGKSSLMQVLLRLVETTSGKVTVDGVDISKIGLSDLRTAIGIIPQEALLFQGTIRTNLDPFNVYDDTVLWDALRRSWLVGSKDGKGSTEATSSRFSLDSTVEEEGGNLSVGERSLVSLARALVKNSKIVCLDEATSSVDLATDAKIQETIRTEFKDKTLLCIAHRLRTIISYDKILVMDQGILAEYDAPEILFEQGGIFAGMCERSGISLDDILKAQMLKNPHFSEHHPEETVQQVVEDVQK